MKTELLKSKENYLAKFKSELSLSNKALDFVTYLSVAPIIIINDLHRIIYDYYHAKNDLLHPRLLAKLHKFEAHLELNVFPVTFPYNIHKLIFEYYNYDDNGDKGSISLDYDCNFKNKNIRLLFEKSIKTSNEEMVCILLNENPELANCSFIDGKTALHHAIDNDSTIMLQLLLAAKADINQIGIGEKTNSSPLEYALEKKTLVKEILNNENTPIKKILEYLINQNNLETLEVIFTHKPELLKEQERELLEQAVSNDNSDLLKFLLEKELDAGIAKEICLEKRKLLLLASFDESNDEPHSVLRNPDSESDYDNMEVYNNYNDPDPSILLGNTDTFVIDYI